MTAQPGSRKDEILLYFRIPSILKTILQICGNRRGFQLIFFSELSVIKKERFTRQFLNCFPFSLSEFCVVCKKFSKTNRMRL